MPRRLATLLVAAGLLITVTFATKVIQPVIGATVPTASPEPSEWLHVNATVARGAPSTRSAVGPREIARAKALERSTPTPKPTPKPIPKPPQWLWPVAGPVVQGFGCTGFYLEPTMYGCLHFHSGIDIVAPYGASVAAACSGIIVWSGWKNDGGGIVVDIACDNGLTVSNNHLSRWVFLVGTRVRVGTRVGSIGSTGLSTGAHLHFSILRHGIYLNPLAYL